MRRWDDCRGGDLPLLVVFISALSLLETALRREQARRDRDRSQNLNLEAGLNSELAAGRAFGIRSLIGMQTVTGMELRWRAQIRVFLAGHQPNESPVKPNTGRTEKQIAAPPHRLPPPLAGAGVFTVVSGAQCVTVRAPSLDDAERRANTVAVALLWWASRRLCAPSLALALAGLPLRRPRQRRTRRSARLPGG